MDDKIVERLFSWLQLDEPAPPYELELMPTNRKCNLNCVYCWQRAEEEVLSNQIADKKYLELIDQAAELGIEEVAITGGGEPLMFDSFGGLVRKIKKRSMYGSLVTNGTLFDEELVSTMVKMGWDKISISLDGARAETQNALRGNNSFKRVISGLKMIKRFKDQFNQEKPQLWLDPVLCNRNYQEIPLFIELAGKFDIFGVHFQPLTVYKQEMNQYKITDEQRQDMRQYLERGLQLASDYGIKNNLDQFQTKEFTTDSGNVIDSLEKTQKTNEKLPMACFRPWYYLRVFPVEKTAGPCLYTSDYAGLVEKNSLKEIWYSGQLNDLRERLKSGDIPDYCQSCCGGNVIETRRFKAKLEQLMEKRNSKER